MLAPQSKKVVGSNSSVSRKQPCKAAGGGHIELVWQRKIESERRSLVSRDKVLIKWSSSIGSTQRTLICHKGLRVGPSESR